MPNVLLSFTSDGLGLERCCASTRLRTACFRYCLICSLVRLILAAEERLFALVVYSPLQVCSKSSSPLIQSFILLCSPLWSSVTQGPFIVRVLTGYGPCPASSLNTASLHPSSHYPLRLQSYRITHSFKTHQSSFFPPPHPLHH